MRLKPTLELFVEAFGANVDQKLLLRDLAKNDIELYVKDKLLEDKCFSKLMNQKQAILMPN
jgi:hypothetical protein